MSDISDITTLVRYLLNDDTHTMTPGDIFTYGTSAIFTLSEPNVVTVSAVLVNDVEVGSGDYSYDADTNKVTVSASLSAGDTVEIRYTYYPDFSISEIESYIRAAVIHLSVNNYYTFEVDVTGDNFYPEVTDKEKNLIALVASILMRPDNISYRLPDIAFTVPNALPTRDIISRTVAIYKNNNTGIFTIA